MISRAAGLMLRENIGQFEKAAMKAFELYTDDKRVLGNTFLAEARQHSVIINDCQRWSTISIMKWSKRGIRSWRMSPAYSIVAVAIILGIATTLIILRSILVPLRHVVSAMEGITSGDLNTPLPPEAGNEIGAMSKTLRLFRESIVERTRLAEERDHQRRMIETALRTIPDGLVLYDQDDRVVLCNNKFRDLYPGIADLIVPGIKFAEILRAVVDRKLIDLGERTPEEWIAERIRQHSDPTGLPEYQYNGTWVR